MQIKTIECPDRKYCAHNDNNKTKKYMKYHNCNAVLNVRITL